MLTSSKKPRWAFIHPFQLRLQRGIEVYLWELSSALAKNAVDVEILTWKGSLTIPPYASPLIKVRVVPYSRYYQSTLAIPFYAWELLTQNYDHVFVHFAGYGEGSALSLVRQVKKIPFSLIFHFPRSQVPQRYKEFEDWGFHRNAEHLIGVSRSTAMEVEEWAYRPCEVIGHGVDTDRFRPDAALRTKTRRLLGIDPDANILISVAALEERKGMQWVIHVLPEVMQRLPNTYYLIVGEGPYRKSLEAQIQELGLHEHVLMLGFQRDTSAYLCASDLMLTLSYGEASSISLLEAMAAGLPVIASCSGPFPELVKNEWGRMIDGKSTDVLAKEIISLLLDLSLREGMGRQARKWVEHNNIWDRVAKEYCRLID